MKKLLISMLFASAIFACSSDKEPQKVLVLDNCCEAKDMVMSNRKKIKHAFEVNDAETIGKLEIQNRNIIRNNMECFPKVKEHIEEWKKMHDDM